MKQKLTLNNKYEIVLDYSVEKDLKSFKEEVLNSLYNIHKELSIENQTFSGGMDSVFILRSLLELGITPKLHTFSFFKNQTDYDSLLAKEQCKKFGVKEPEFFYLDKNAFFDHVKFTTFDRKIAFPFLHGYYVDYFLSTKKDEKFFCGMSVEYKTSDGIITMNPGPFIVKKHNPNRLYGFDDSRTFLAYINHSLFKENYLNKNPTNKRYGENVWYIRDLVYKSCYPEIDIIKKTFPYDKHIVEEFESNLSPVIQALRPAVFRTIPFRFDAKEYLDKKEVN